MWVGEHATCVTSQLSSIPRVKVHREHHQIVQIERGSNESVFETAFDFDAEIVGTYMYYYGTEGVIMAQRVFRSVNIGCSDPVSLETTPVILHKK